MARLSLIGGWQHDEASSERKFTKHGIFSLSANGRLAVSARESGAISLKFNPWHDPEDGRFAHVGSGNYFGPGSNRTREYQRSSQKPKSLPEPKTRRVPAPSHPEGSSDQVSGMLLSSVHREFLSYSRKYPPRRGTQDVWPSGGIATMSKSQFKDQFIAGHSNAFRAAAAQSDIPVELVASVAHAELGNDVNNDLAYALRAEDGRNLPDIPVLREFNKPPTETSFGPYNIQVRRAAEILGYGDISKMPETARRILVPTTRDPVAATFMLAKHLSDLRDLDFPGVTGKDLTMEQMLITATRYRMGPERNIENIRRNIRHGKDYLSNWNNVRELLL